MKAASRTDRLVWVLVGVTFLALLGWGWVRWNRFLPDSARQIEADISRATAATAATIGQWVEDRRRDAELLAAFASPGLVDSGPASDAFLNHAISTLDIRRDYSGIWLIGEDGGIRTSAPGSMPFEARFIELALGAMVTGEPKSLGPIVGGDARVLLGISHPISTPSDSGSLPSVGAVVLADDLVKAFGMLEAPESANDSSTWTALLGLGGDSIAVLSQAAGQPLAITWLPADSMPTAYRPVPDSAVSFRRGSGRNDEDVFAGTRRVPGADLLVVRAVRASAALRAGRIELLRDYAEFAGLFALGLAGVVVVGRQNRIRSLRENAQSGERERLKYHSLFEYSHDGVAISDENGHLLEVNRPLVSMLGYDADEMVGRLVESFHAPGEPPRRTLDSGKNGILPLIERRLLRKDGSHIWVEVNAACVPGPEGEPSHVQSVVRDITARKQAEVALRESEARWRSIAEAPFEIVSVLGPDHVIQMVNRVPEGYAEGQLVGASVYDLIRPEQHEGIREILTRVFETGESAYYETQSRSTDRWYANAAGAIADGLGVTAATVLSWDITELHLAREEVVRARDHYRTMLATFPFLVWQADPVGSRTYFNDTWLGFVGRPLEDELGNGWATHVHPDDLDQYMTVHRGALAIRKPYEVDYRIRDRDNKYRVLRESGQPFVDQEGNFAGFLGVAQDISRRWMAERAHRISESRLVEAQRVAGLGHWTWDIATNDVWWSAEALRLFGHDPEITPATFEGFMDAVHEDDRAMVQEALDAAVRGGSRLALDHRIKHADGTVLHVQERGEIIRGSDGTPHQMTGTCHDITERKLAEDAVRELNTSLEHRVERRTQELQMANDELESFAYSVSHDLKAPLRAISGYSGILFEGFADSLTREGRRLIGEIQGETTKMERLIDELLAFSRIASADLRMATVDMRALVSEVIPDVNADGVEIRLGELPPAVGDAVLLRQVWTNMIENAVKFSRPKSHPVIEISARQDPGETVYWVRDNGVGFPGEYRDQVFGVFQRLHEDPEFAGTGVGLATVQRIVLRHGGQVWADGKVGGGAIVTFSLPHRSAPTTG